MKNPLFLAALCAALPVCAAAQDDAPAKPPCGGAEPQPRSSSALPARATTRPEPQLGSVAPATWVPPHADTPSSRAMRAVREREERSNTTQPAGAGDTSTQADCQPATLPLIKPAPGKK